MESRISSRPGSLLWCGPVEETREKGEEIVSELSTNVFLELPALKTEVIIWISVFNTRTCPA